MATPSTEQLPVAPPAPYRLSERRRETHDTWTVELQPMSGVPLVVRPGQFTMLYAFGIGEVPISVSGDTTGPLVHTIRSVGAVTAAICEAGVVGVRGPFGNAWPVDRAAGADVVVIAGGIGLAPLRPAVYELLRNRERYHRVTVLYGSRTPSDLLYCDELDSWRAAGVDVAVFSGC